MIKPMKVMVEFLPDKNMKQMINTVEVFINEMSNLLSVFDNYTGGDFCRGAIFGKSGAQMLTQITKTAIRYMMKMGSQSSSKPALPL